MVVVVVVVVVVKEAKLSYQISVGQEGRQKDTTAGADSGIFDWGVQTLVKKTVELFFFEEGGGGGGK